MFSVFSPLRAHPTDCLFLFSGNRLTKKRITMAEPNEYISVTQKNFLSDDNEGRLVEKSFLEIQGTFLVKIHDNTFNGTIRENAFKHIDNFLKVVGPLEIKWLSHDRFRLSVFPISLIGAASELFKKDCIGSVTTWEGFEEKFVQKFYQLYDNNEEMETDKDDDPNDIANIFKIEENLFDFETPLCKAFNKFNYLLKIDTGDLEEPWSDNGVPYQLCDHIFTIIVLRMKTIAHLYLDVDRFCNDGELPEMVWRSGLDLFSEHKVDLAAKKSTMLVKYRSSGILCML
ncbi:hypothetical protein Tco_0793724 [Tanacetum coccineum]